MSDLPLFDYMLTRNRTGKPVTSPKVRPEAKRRRLTGQCGEILARLRQGKATAHDLARLALNYRARVSDLRAAGYDVRCDENTASGVSIYTLVSEPQ